MSKKKVVYIISDIDKALAFEWISIGLRERFDLLFVLIGNANPELANFFESNHIQHTILSDQQYPTALQKASQLFRIFIKVKPDVIHSHLWRANLLSQPIAWFLRINKRIYTRHHATIHYNEFPSGRKWDLLVNRLATDIVAISDNIKEILVKKDKANRAKIVTIPHGFDLKYFKTVSESRIQEVRQRHRISSSAAPVIGVISRYLEWKGVHFVIEAFKQLKEQYPTALLVLANTQGNYTTKIKALLSELNEECYREINFENDIAALYHVFTVYVHVPIDPHVEAFGQTYIESLASGIPSVFTLSGIAREFIQDSKNALVVPYKNSDAICVCVRCLLEDDRLKEQLVSNGLQSIKIFSEEKMIEALAALYNR
jgi:glycosyltransferase involved in cell wall biosynthesis